VSGILASILADAAPAELAALAEQLQPYLEHRDDELLTPELAAERLGVHPKTLTRAANAGRVAGATRVGSRWRFHASELELRGVPRAPATTTTPAPPARPRTQSNPTAEAIRGQTNRRTA
jgi:excisionase family DNA binding protein